MYDGSQRTFVNYKNMHTLYLMNILDIIEFIN